MTYEQPVNELERALLRALLEEDGWMAVYRELQTAEVLVAHVPQADDVFGDDGVPEVIRCATLEREGETCIAVFTSHARAVVAMHKDALRLAITAGPLMRTWGEAPVVLNPGSELGVYFPPALTAAIGSGAILERGPVRVVAQEDCGEVHISSLPFPEPEVESCVAAVLRDRGDVASAWIAWWSEGEQRRKGQIVIALDTDVSIKEVAAACDRALAGSVDADREVTYVKLTDSRFGGPMRAAGTCFFERGDGVSVRG